MNSDGCKTGELRQTPGLVGSRAHQSASPFPLCFAMKQAVGIIVLDSSALRDGPPPGLNRGQCKEKRRKRKGKDRKEAKWRKEKG